jgi:hypothetical protein
MTAITAIKVTIVVVVVVIVGAMTSYTNPGTKN